MSIVYHSTDPESTQNFYGEYNNVDFVISVGPGRSLVQNSVRVVGDIRINEAADTRSTDGIYFDHRSGIHSVVESIQTTFNGQGGGVKENIQNYARWVTMTSLATKATTDMLNADMQCELRGPNDACSNQYAKGSITRGTTPITTDLDFSMKPQCILNRMNGDHLPHEKSGDIRLTLNLARNISALMGFKAGTNAGYELRNLRVTYNSIATEGRWDETATQMRSVYNVKSSILGSSANVSAQVPAVCDAVSCSFQRQDFENVNVYNNNLCSPLPGIRQLQFQFNNSTSEYITYELSDQNEMLHRYLDSFVNTGYNQVYLDSFRNGASFGIGLEFNGFVDLSNQNFGVQLTSDVSNINPYNIFLYFHSLIRV
tara:strand:+ start:3068 stop:4180 length:1113 start_codon:yes stop_codon:yes gene_type:complete